MGREMIEWDFHEILHRHSEIHHAHEVLYTAEILLLGQTRQTLGTFISLTSHI